MAGSTALRKQGSSDNYKQILEAFLDSFGHPVWIEDSDGNIMMNETARIIESQGVSLRQASRNVAVGEEKSVSVMGRKLRVHKKDMNHGTNCILHEVKVEEDPATKLRESTFRLRTALAR